MVVCFLGTLLLIYYLGHVAVRGKERADRSALTASDAGIVTMDNREIVDNIYESMLSRR